MNNINNVPLNQYQMERALRAIQCIVDAYYAGSLQITTDFNGYGIDMYGLDIIMAIIENHINDGLYGWLRKEELYV